MVGNKDGLLCLSHGLPLNPIVRRNWKRRYRFLQDARRGMAVSGRAAGSVQPSVAAATGLGDAGRHDQRDHPGCAASGLKRTTQRSNQVTPHRMRLVKPKRHDNGCLLDK